MCSILENVSYALEKKVYSSAFGWNVLKISMRSISSNVSFKTCVSTYGTLSLTKEARIYNGVKTISLTSGAGKTGQPLVKE